MKDLSHIQIGTSYPTHTFSRFDKKNYAVLNIHKSENSDTIKLKQEVDKTAANFAKQIPSSFKIKTFLDETEYTQNSWKTITTNALFGLILVFLFFFIFLPGRIGWVGALSLPLTFLSVLGYMVAMGINFNVITMLALIICIGMLIDNASVISERYTKLLESNKPPQEAAVTAVVEFAPALISTSLTTILAFLPMLVTKGVMGQFIRYIPILVSFSLFLSLFEAFFLLPARLQFMKLPKNKKPSKFSFLSIYKKIEGVFYKNIAFSLRYVKSTLVFLFLITIMSVGIGVKFNKFVLFSQDKTRFYQITFTYKNKISQDHFIKDADEIEAGIRKVISTEDVNYILTNLKNNKQMEVTIVATANFERQNKASEIENQLRENMPNVPDIANLYVGAMKGGPPAGSDLEVTFLGGSYEELSVVAEKFIDKAKNFPGMVSLENELQQKVPQWSLTPKTNTLAQLGLNVSEMGRFLRLSLEGSPVNDLHFKSRPSEITLRFHQKENFLSTPIPSRGSNVALRNLVKAEEINLPEALKHLDFTRAHTLLGSINNKETTSLEVNKKAKKVAKEILQAHPNVRMKLGGAEETTNESLGSLKIAMLLALLAILGIMVIHFNSYTIPLLIASVIPFSLIGVFWGFLIHKEPLSFLAFIGVVGLMGVTVNVAIILISQIENLKRQEPHLSLDDVLIQSSVSRLRPVIITSFTTLGGLIPTAYSIGGYDPTSIPVTLAMAWGIASGTLGALFFVPSAYKLRHQLKTKVLKLFGIIK